MKRNTSKKVALKRQTGQDGSDGLSDLDHAILDIIDRKSVQLIGIDVPDDPPHFLTSGEQTPMIPEQRRIVCIPGITVQNFIRTIFEMPHSNLRLQHKINAFKTLVTIN